MLCKYTVKSLRVFTLNAMHENMAADVRGASCRIAICGRRFHIYTG